MLLKGIPVKIEATHARTAATGTAPPLNMGKLEMRLDEISRSEKYIKKEGDSIKLVLPGKILEDKSDKTVVYRTQAVAKTE